MSVGPWEVPALGFLRAPHSGVQPLVSCAHPGCRFSNSESRKPLACAGGENSPEKTRCLLACDSWLLCKPQIPEAQCTLGWHPGWPQTSTLGCVWGTVAKLSPSRWASVTAGALAWTSRCQYKTMPF